MARSQIGLESLEEKLDLYFNKKAPALPAGVKDFLVSIGPWLVLISVVLSVPALLALIGISSFVMPYSSMGMMGYYSSGSMWMVSNVLLVVTLVLEALAVPGLFNKTKQGWNFIFYASLVSIISSLVYLNLLGAVISAVISFYFLFQLRSYYR